MKTKFAALLLASVALAGCDALTPVETVECGTVAQTECLNAWFDEKFEEGLAFSPISQTGLGRKTDYDKIDDFSEEAQLEQLEWMRAATAQMEASFDYDELTPDAQLSWDMWKFRLEQAERAWEFREQAYILHQMGSAQSELPTFLLTQHRVDDESDMQAFIARIGGIGGAMDQLLARAKANAAAGTRPPRFAYDAVILESKNLTSGAPFDRPSESGEPSAMWQAVERHLASLTESGTITAERAEELREEARTALTEQFAPAYARVIAWYEEDRPNTSEQAQGATALPNGEAFYAASLKEMTTTDLTADEIHQIGLDEVERIQGEMRAIMEQVGFEGTLQEFFEFTRTDPQFFYPDNEAGAQAYIAQAKEHIDTLTERLPEFFGTLPKAPLEVRRVEPFREQDGAAQHYQSGTPDGSRPGIYYAHLSDMNAMPIPELESIAYHEGNPGHHMQVSIAQELEGVPKFRSQGGFISAFGEGWALYTETLAKEMGGYKDPYSDFGRLSSEIWRAIRLVVDTGIHAKGWSEEEAVQYALENSPNPEAAVRSEVQRYYVLPGQATSYKIGMIRIQELRAKAEEELGDKFDIRGFHDTILGGGAVPLSIMETRVNRWIESQKAA
ncbi:DUF885 domain-containing protein [Erythrobacter sp. SCSIO 43205]|uniref:DUF885 domain-containing protein n=1 Tax=Erythrobacter sp. SCSIO 43205 TaxID=2779361 RepID=UPI001CA884AE|nr:DUF885 domain-containing protein [Erythrobacter sp. SCSIO 43205]UAB78266.1 DUF885 domain-containing protein [Erythrobacter sp. SCSIO 43205]